MLSTYLPGSSIGIETNKGSLYHRISLNISQDQLTLIQKTMTSSKYHIGMAIEKVYLISLPSKDFTKNFKKGRLCAEAVTLAMSQIILREIVAIFCKIECLIYQIHIF